MLHLANGESTRRLLESAHMPGEIRSVDEILMEGPPVFDASDAKGLLARGGWLEARFGIPKAEYFASAARVERSVRQAAEFDEVVVWSEADVFCQVNLVNLLARLDGHPRVSLVCPEEARLGLLSPDALAAWFEKRVLLDEAAFAAAQEAWAVWAAPEPTRLLSMRAPWPGLAQAFRDHARRFPSTRNGLGAVEAAALHAVSDEGLAFPQVHEKCGPALHAYGLGDVQVHGALRALAGGAAPLVAVDDPRALEDLNSGGVWRATDAGRAVLSGAQDAIALRGVDAWLGGVRLEGPTARWRWDEKSGAFVEG